MSTIKFSWDERKDIANNKKHGISFEDAKTVFFDEDARIIADPDHSETEDRFILLGRNSSTKLLVVCHCYRENDSIIRIISARKATRHETKQYRGFLS